MVFLTNERREWQYCTDVRMRDMSLVGTSTKHWDNKDKRVSHGVFQVVFSNQWNRIMAVLYGCAHAWNVTASFLIGCFCQKGISGISVLGNLTCLLVSTRRQRYSEIYGCLQLTIIKAVFFLLLCSFVTYRGFEFLAWTSAVNLMIENSVKSSPITA